MTIRQAVRILNEHSCDWKVDDNGQLWAEEHWTQRMNDGSVKGFSKWIIIDLDRRDWLYSWLGY